MAENASFPKESLIPPQPIPEEARAFSERVHGLLDGKPKDEATVRKALEGMDEMFDRIAAGLYSLASMLAGEGEESIRLVETTVATAEVSVCHDPVEGRKASRRTLAAAALDLLEKREPGCLGAPEDADAGKGCIEEDDLRAAGVSSEDLERMMAGPDRERVRKWLAGLATVVRTVFVLRAVAGFNRLDTAALLRAHGGARAAGWTPEAVSEIFRQGLCSLASQLLHAVDGARS